VYLSEAERLSTDCEHYTNSTKRVRLEQSGLNHHLSEIEFVFDKI